MGVLSFALGTWINEEDHHEWLIPAFQPKKKKSVLSPQKSPTSRGEPRAASGCLHIPISPKLFGLIQSHLLHFSLPIHPLYLIQSQAGKCCMGETRTPGKAQFAFPEEGLDHGSMTWALFCPQLQLSGPLSAV